MWDYNRRDGWTRKKSTITFKGTVVTSGTVVPAAELQGDRHAGVAKFIGQRTVYHGTGHDHATDTHGSCGLSGIVAGSAILRHAVFQGTDHGLKNRFESALYSFVASGDVGRQRNHGTGIFDALEVLSRQVSAHNLGAYVGRKPIDLYAFPAILPVRIGKEAVQDFSVEVTLAFEVAVKAAVSESGASHDLRDRYIVEAMTVKQPPGALNNLGLYFSTVSSRIGHG